jgi:hypothetical protein
MVKIAKTTETVTIPRAEYETLRTENESLEKQVAWFMELLQLSKRHQFGASSEKATAQTSNVQLNLFNEAETTAEPAVEEPAIEEVKAHKRKKSRKAVDRFPPDLPVETIEHRLHDDECVCPDCGGALHEMKQEVREELKLVPAKAVMSAMYKVFMRVGTAKRITTMCQ